MANLISASDREILRTFQCPRQDLPATANDCSSPSCPFGHSRAAIELDPDPLNQLSILPDCVCYLSLIGICPLPVKHVSTQALCERGFHCGVPALNNLPQLTEVYNRLLHQLILEPDQPAQSSAQCPICLEKPANSIYGMQVHCGHLFCVACIVDWHYNHSSTCPVCTTKSFGIVAWAPGTLTRQEDREELQQWSYALKALHYRRTLLRSPIDLCQTARQLIEWLEEKVAIRNVLRGI